MQNLPFKVKNVLYRYFHRSCINVLPLFTSHYNKQSDQSTIWCCLKAQIIARKQPLSYFKFTEQKRSAGSNILLIQLTKVLLPNVEAHFYNTIIYASECYSTATSLQSEFTSENFSRESKRVFSFLWEKKSWKH